MQIWVTDSWSSSPPPSDEIWFDIVITSATIHRTRHLPPLLLSQDGVVPFRARMFLPASQLSTLAIGLTRGGGNPERRRLRTLRESISKQ
ncbi:hypothetical protein CPSG_05874 [Coccidioides posadasii str. Silveira]|uniref:Uncharacterized protein n=1 Tax=Coccidioides posadasii (strain RMSCC 757 / Silveira) TaxID=443226 RepID=E9D7S2_COCPS|nr:hypothetical protein CPSG_05874 [Coccidioides posadasii str. Silveira]